MTRLVLFCVLSACLAPQCSARKIKTLVAAPADFGSYKTYRWVPVKTLGKAGIVEDDPVLAPVIRQAVNLQLAALGMTEVQEGADLEVATFASTSSVPQLEAVIFPGGMWLDYQTPIAGIGRYNKEGTFAINLIDTRAKKSVFACIATDSLDNKPGSGAAKIPGVTAAMFRKVSTRKK